MNASPYTRVEFMYLPMQNKLANFGSLSARMFLFCFYPWPYLLTVKTFGSELGYVFSIAAHVVRNLFLKICPLFGQILITCVKCSRASFLPSSYSEKMRWGRGCTFTIAPRINNRSRGEFPDKSRN